MEPTGVTPEHWTAIQHGLVFLVVFTALGLNAALTFLFAHAVLPSFAASGDMPRPIATVRWLLYPLAIACVLMAAAALVRALSLLGPAGMEIFPRVGV